MIMPANAQPDVRGPCASRGICADPDVVADDVRMPGANLSGPCLQELLLELQAPQPFDRCEDTCATRWHEPRKALASRLVVPSVYHLVTRLFRRHLTRWRERTLQRRTDAGSTRL